MLFAATTSDAQPFCALLVTACRPPGEVIHIAVRDESGSPVSSASVTFHWTTNEPWGPGARSGDPHSTTVTTNSSGAASARVTSYHYVRIDVAHPSHHPASVQVVDSALSAHTTAGTALAIPLQRLSAPASTIPVP